MHFATRESGLNLNSIIKLKIIDCFLFFNEIDLLKLRLKELNDVVDHFVLVESMFTFTNNRKTLFFEQNKEIFREYLPKITHLVFDKKTPNRFWRSDRKTCWLREERQRNYLGQGIKSLKPNDDDLIIISDVDEIPDPETVESLKDNNFEGIANLNQDMYYYNHSCKHPLQFDSAIVANFEPLKPHISSLHRLRIKRSHIDDKKSIERGGWHFSFFGSNEQISYKIKSFSHSEFNTSNINNHQHIDESVESRKDLFNRYGDTKFEFIDPKSNKYLPRNIHLLDNFLSPKV